MGNSATIPTNVNAIRRNLAILWTPPIFSGDPPNGLEMSRPASPKLVSHESQTLGWPGRLHRVVRRAQETVLLLGVSVFGRSCRLCWLVAKAAIREEMVQLKGKKRDREG